MLHWQRCLSGAICVVILAIAMSDDPLVTITSSSPLKNSVDGFIKVPKNSDAFITCAVTNKPTDSDVKWIVKALGANGMLTSISTDLSSEDPFKYSLEKPSQTEWRLKVQNVQVTDEGKYTCRVQTWFQTYVSAIAHLRVTEVPRIADLQTSSDTTVKMGDNVLLSCNATGRPFPVVSWSRMEGGILPTGGQELQAYYLNIPSAKAEHSGIYKCNAKNFAGSDSRNIHLQVKFPPHVTVNSPKVGQYPGYHKDLSCLVTAFPQPDTDGVSWMHVNQPITNDGRHIITNLKGAYNRITSILTIKWVQPSDYGIYRCSARNTQGDQEASIELVASDVPTPDRSGKINRSSTLSISFMTIIMLLATCFLHRVHL